MPITVVIVEDLEEVRTGLRQIISADARFKVVASFADAESASENLVSLLVDIVIMDINLPGMNGIDCIKLIKGKCTGTQFMMFTVYENNEQVFDALKAGAMGYLLKKSSPQKIIESLIELHNGGSPMSANIARKLVSSLQIKTAPNASSYLLSARENEVLELLSEGLLYKEISDKLGISTATVRQHIHNIYEKLHVQNRTEALNKAFYNK
ncbi:MAG: response regulator transcription factor [Flavobacterium sp.]|nr:response regulator transcription factor [Pedobacter sp.]